MSEPSLNLLRKMPQVHGGVRYLEKAVFNLDYGQLKLVFEALHERKRLLENAPHLTNALPIMTVQNPTTAARQSRKCIAGAATGVGRICCKLGRHVNTK